MSSQNNPDKNNPAPGTASDQSASGNIALKYDYQHLDANHKALADRWAALLKNYPHILHDDPIKVEKAKKIVKDASEQNADAVKSDFSALTPDEQSWTIEFLSKVPGCDGLATGLSVLKKGENLASNWLSVTGGSLSIATLPLHTINDLLGRASDYWNRITPEQADQFAVMYASAAQATQESGGKTGVATYGKASLSWLASTLAYLLEACKDIPVIGEWLASWGEWIESKGYSPTATFSDHLHDATRNATNADIASAIHDAAGGALDPIMEVAKDGATLSDDHSNKVSVDPTDPNQGPAPKNENGQAVTPNAAPPGTPGPGASPLAAVATVIGDTAKQEYARGKQIFEKLDTTQQKVVAAGLGTYVAVNTTRGFAEGVAKGAIQGRPFASSVGKKVQKAVAAEERVETLQKRLAAEEGKSSPRLAKTRAELAVAEQKAERLRGIADVAEERLEFWNKARIGSWELGDAALGGHKWTRFNPISPYNISRQTGKLLGYTGRAGVELTKGAYGLGGQGLKGVGALADTAMNAPAQFVAREINDIASMIGTSEWSVAHTRTANQRRLEARKAELEARKAMLEAELEDARALRQGMDLKDKFTNRDAYNIQKQLNGRTGNGGVNGELRKVNKQLDPLAETKAEKDTLEAKKVEQAKALQEAKDQGAKPADIRKAEANLRKTETAIEKAEKKLNKTTNWRGKPVEVGVEAKAMAAEEALAKQRAAVKPDSLKAKRLAVADHLHGLSQDVLDDGIIRTAKARMGGVATVAAEPAVQASPEPSPTTPAPAAAAKAPEPVVEAKRVSPWAAASTPRPVAGRPNVTVQGDLRGKNIIRVSFPAPATGATASLGGVTSPVVANDVGHTQALNQGNLAVKPQAAHAETPKTTMIDASKVGQGAAAGQPLPQAANANPAPQVNATPQPTPKLQPVPSPEPIPEVEIVGKPRLGLKGGMGAFGAPIIGGAINGALAASNEESLANTAKAVGIGAADGLLPGVTSGFKNITQNNEKQNWVDQLLNGGATATQGVAVGAGVAAVATSWTGIGALGGGAIAAISGATSIGIGLIHDATYQAGLSKQGGLITGIKDTGEAFSQSKKGEGVKGWWKSTMPTWLGGASAASAPATPAVDANAQVKQQVSQLLGQMDSSQTSQKIFHHAHANLNEIISYLEKNHRLDDVKRLAADGLNGSELQRELLATIGITQQAFVQEKQQMQNSLDSLHQAVAEATMRAKAAAAGGAMKAHDVKLGVLVTGSAQPQAHPVASRTAGVVIRPQLQQA